MYVCHFPYPYYPPINHLLADNRGRGRGGRGNGPQRGGRRPFDKHSQTGKTSVPLAIHSPLPSLPNPSSDSEKKVHHSWGGDDGNTELKNEEAANLDAAAEGAAATTDWAADSAPTNDWGAPDAAAPADAWGAPDATAPDATAPAQEGDKPEGRPRRERDLEEEDNTLTLEQYLSQQKDKESLIPKLEGTRKANEGADANIWKDVVPLQKEDEDAYFVGKVQHRIRSTLLPDLPSSSVSRPRPLRKPVPKRKTKYFWRSTLGSNALTVVVVVAEVAIGEVIGEATEPVVVADADAVLRGVVARLPSLPSMSMTKLPSLPCPEYCGWVTKKITSCRYPDDSALVIVIAQCFFMARPLHIFNSMSCLLIPISVLVLLFLVRTNNLLLFGVLF